MDVFVSCSFNSNYKLVIKSLVSCEVKLFTGTYCNNVIVSLTEKGVYRSQLFKLGLTLQYM